MVLPCHPDTRFLRNNPKVEWRKKDKNILVCLYHNGENRPEEQSEDYHNRAHFFIDEIEHGNFSLRLNNLRAKDKGFYTCKVYIEQDCVFSAETKLVKGKWKKDLLLYVVAPQYNSCNSVFALLWHLWG